MPFPSPGDLPDPGIKSGSPALKADLSLSKTPGKPRADRRAVQIKLSTANTSNGYGNRSKAEKQERNGITDLEYELMRAREGGKDGGKG